MYVTRKREEVLLRTPDVSVRCLLLGPNEAVPWHRHTEVDDFVVCLSGRIEVRQRDPDQAAVLSPGQRHHVPAGRTHQVANLDASDSEYLLIQGVGAYDFVVSQT